LPGVDRWLLTRDTVGKGLIFDRSSWLPLPACTLLPLACRFLPDRGDAPPKTDAVGDDIWISRIAEGVRKGCSAWRGGRISVGMKPSLMRSSWYLSFASTALPASSKSSSGYRERAEMLVTLETRAARLFEWDACVGEERWFS